MSSMGQPAQQTDPIEDINDIDISDIKKVLKNVESALKSVVSSKIAEDGVRCIEAYQEAVKYLVDRHIELLRSNKKLEAEVQHYGLALLDKRREDKEIQSNVTGAVDSATPCC